MRPGPIKGMDAAVLTKQMLGNARIKFVAAEIINASEKLKLLWRHNQVEKPLFPTDGAAAILHFFLTRDVDAKAHSAAVAAAFVGLKGRMLRHDGRLE